MAQLSPAVHITHMITLEKLLHDTEQFLAAVREPLSPVVFRDCIRCLEDQVNQLSYETDIEEINAALAEVSQWDYADSTNMVFMNHIVIPEIENFLAVIQKQSSLSLAC